MLSGWKAALSGPIGIFLLVTVIIAASSAGAYYAFSPKVSQQLSYTCISPTESAILNGSTTYKVVQVCSIQRIVLNSQGCYDFSSGATLCVKGAPQNTVADWYINGTIVAKYPNGYEVRCDILHGGGNQPCLAGIP